MAETFLDTMAVIQPRPSSFRAVVEPGSLQNIPDYLYDADLGGRRIFTITDTNVAHHHGPALIDALDGSFDGEILEIEPGEAYKNLEQPARLWEQLTDCGAQRSDVILALGGGVVGDLAGFVASAYMRGVPLVHVPTTVLAMVDSSIGGKTGIDHGAKNNVGSFYQPRLIVADPTVLKTLGEREYTEGFGEVIKTGMLRPDFLPTLEDNARALARFSPKALPTLSHAIAQCVEYKIGVVKNDPHEQNSAGGRVLLNYGHTLGHALEAAGGYRELLHGEGVAIGMEFAMQLSHRLGVLEAPGLSARQTALLETYGLPTRYEGSAGADAILDKMAKDKKNTGNDTTRFVLPVSLGKMVVERIPNHEVAAAVQDFLAQ